MDSARGIVSFSDACAQHGAFEKLEFISTVGVAGNMSGTVPERAFGEARTFRNSYEEAKAEAETLLLQQIERGLPATIHRPSMVVGDSRDGTIIQFQVFYYLCEFLSGRRTVGVVPETHDIRLDVVPVDYVPAPFRRRASAGTPWAGYFICAPGRRTPRKSASSPAESAPSTSRTAAARPRFAGYPCR